jgi:hypothetical protein
VHFEFTILEGCIIWPLKSAVSSYLSSCCTLASFLANFRPYDGGNTFLRNVGSHTDCKALYPRRWHKSNRMWENETGIQSKVRELTSLHPYWELVRNTLGKAVNSYVKCYQGRLWCLLYVGITCEPLTQGISLEPLTYVLSITKVPSVLRNIGLNIPRTKLYDKHSRWIDKTRLDTTDTFQLKHQLW